MAAAAVSSQDCIGASKSRQVPAAAGFGLVSGSGGESQGAGRQQGKMGGRVRIEMQQKSKHSLPKEDLGQT